MDKIFELAMENPLGLILVEVVLISFIIGRAICWVISRVKKEKLGKLTFKKAMLYIGYGIIPTIIMTNEIFKDSNVGFEKYDKPNSYIEEQTEWYEESEEKRGYDPEYWKAFYEIRSREVFDE